MVQADTDAGAFRDGLDAVFRVQHAVGDVFVPVTVGAGGVAGQHEVFEAAQVQVVGPAEAGFEHPAAPDGSTERECHVVGAPRLQVPAHAADLQVDDPAGVEFQCLPGGFR